MRRTLLLGVALCVALSLWASAEKIGIVWDSVGRGDLSFNDSCYAGVVKAVQDFGFDGVIDVASPSAADFVPNLRSMAQRSDIALIIGNGYLITEAMGQVAKEFPNKKFANIDGWVPDIPNMCGFLFKEGEGAALIGATMAFLALEQGFKKVGVIFGIEGSVLYHFEAGYRIGVDWACAKYQQEYGLAAKPSLTMLMPYSGTWYDPPLGKQLALTQIGEGVIGIFNVSGGVGIGIMQGIAEYHANTGTNSGAPYYFGVDENQDWWEMGKYGLMSMLKRVDLAAYDAVKRIHDGTFPSGRFVSGLAEKGVYVSGESDLLDVINAEIAKGTFSADVKDTIIANWKNNRSTVTDWVWGAIDELQAAIIDGSIVIPYAETLPEIEAVRAAYPLK